MQVLLQVPITFDIGPGHPPTHAPMTDGAVEGVRARLILDTGASEHILRREVIEGAGLPMQPGEAGTDSAGASVESWTVERVAVTIGSREFSFARAVVIDGPPSFGEWGIAAILSPQHLEPGATAVLDLAADRFFLVDGDWTDVSAWLRSTFPQLRYLELAQVEGDGTVLVQAAIDGFEPVLTLVDTGGKATTFTADAVPGLTVGERVSSGRGVGGTEAFGMTAAGQVLAVGDARLPIPRLIVREDHRGYPGLVGMDLLRGCVLAVSANPGQPMAWLMP
jgi:predicted aspartyl protease